MLIIIILIYIIVYQSIKLTIHLHLALKVRIWAFSMLYMVSHALPSGRLTKWFSDRKTVILQERERERDRQTERWTLSVFEKQVDVLLIVRERNSNSAFS
jgi:hypothetical protein